MRDIFEQMTKEEIIDWMEERFADLDWWDLGSQASQAQDLTDPGNGECPPYCEDCYDDGGGEEE